MEAARRRFALGIACRGTRMARTVSTEARMRAGVSSATTASSELPGGESGDQATGYGLGKALTTLAGPRNVTTAGLNVAE